MPSVLTPGSAADVDLQQNYRSLVWRFVFKDILLIKVINSLCFLLKHENTTIIDGKTLSNIILYRLTDIVITTPMIINMQTPTPTVPPTVTGTWFDEGCAII